MSDTDYTIKARKFHHLTEIQRGQIEAMVKLGESIELRPKSVDNREEFWKK